MSANETVGIFDELKIQNNNEEIDDLLKDKFLEQIDTPKNQEGYYLDAFGERISFNGIRQLKKPYTKLNLNARQQQEIKACHEDYFYFRKNYCKILTKSGIGRPEPRQYQERLENELVQGDDVVAFFPRQSGKCSEKGVYININKGNIYMKLTVESVHNIKEIEKYSKNIKKKERYFMTVEKMLTNKIFKDIILSEIQKEKITELFEVVNNLSFPYKAEWVKKFIIGGLEDNYILRIIRLLEYNNRDDIKPSDNTFEKMEILYGIDYANENYNNRNNKFKKGKDNPGYKHNGKLASLSDNFIYKKTEKEKQAIKDKIARSNKENGNNDTTLLYYVKKSYSENEAKKLLSERQSTFSLEKCIEKYGEIEGFIRFNERQKEWQETLNSKSTEEKKRINKLKGTGINAGWGVQKIRNMGIDKSKNISCKLYYIKFYNEYIEFWKIGITTKTINERFGKELIFENKTGLKREVIKVEETNFYDCFIKEQCILKTNKKARVNINYNNFCSSECFNEDISLEIDDILYKDMQDKI